MGDPDRSAGDRWWRRQPVTRCCVTLLVAVLTAVTLVAGTSAPAAAAVQVVPFETRAADGTGLRGDVYLPGTGGPLATVLELSPYATVIPAGDRLALALGATSAEILPDPLKPSITVATGDQLPGSL